MLLREAESNGRLKVMLYHFSFHCFKKEFVVWTIPSPFSKDNLKKLKILPVTVSEIDYEYCREIAKEFPKDAVYIISSDFTHYGPLYNYNPSEKIEKIDIEAIKLIREFKVKEFLEYASDKTICGMYGIALGMEIMKNMGAERARLLKYYDSSEITNDKENSFCGNRREWNFGCCQFSKRNGL